jgi:hypothetical protein
MTTLIYIARAVKHSKCPRLPAYKLKFEIGHVLFIDNCRKARNEQGEPVRPASVVIDPNRLTARRRSPQNERSISAKGKVAV